MLHPLLRKLLPSTILPGLLCLLLFSCSSTPDITEKYKPQGRKVEVIKKGDTYVLMRNGEPYFIKGAAGYEYYDRLRKYGGNSVRVWHTDDAQQVLDSAHVHGLTVTLGLWMAREREGFNYYDKKLVAQQREELREVVLKYKDHPALLMWGIGNELYADGSNVKVWDAVNGIAEMIHEVDPDHPTTTTVMNVPHKVVNLIAKRAPALDILSINSFGAMHNLPQELASTDWEGPYVISEFGARGYWESYYTWWMAPIEQTSSEKAEFARARYEQSVLADTSRCLGAYVFMWGNKQETTPTWFSLINEKGEETGLVHEMRQLWGDTTHTVNKPPYIAYLTLDNKFAFDQIYLKPEQTFEGAAFTFDPEQDTVEVQWEVLPEAEQQDGNADKQVKPKPVDDVLVKQEGTKVWLRTPRQQGAYRLYLYLRDGQNNLATANIPFFVTNEPLK
ncbi:glycoside hydrolase family 2 TIM barrel-domain containing protein [Pontibacter kalidii]|uniref:glycoside hydrolase family 2 TIM barrel-domain containing protein n=1 Tax=Pontibacter kalidii TaxID=2592049 RepID=UPI0022534CB7|nr:glycoside hydrolase family 2 TIM barrel-domain containing protein [Pontibacter kalidii]